MSLAEAAAALDRLLWGHSQGESLPRGASPNVPPYAPPPMAQENLLPALLPRTYTSQGPVCSTPAASPDEDTVSWETLTYPAPEEFPVSLLHTPTAPPPPSLDGWLALSDPTGHPRSRRTPEEDQYPEERGGSSRSSSPPEAGGDQPTTPTGSFTPLDPEKYKTELCRSYQVHGYCRYGARCNYAHGLRQLRGAAHHGKYKTRNCLSYHLTGCCRYGSRCSFIHDPEEGVLKCSIANKEVLEALYYFPTCEVPSRTASITWRLQEAGSFPTQELHFITTTRPLEDDLGLIVSPRSSPKDSPHLDTGNLLLDGSCLWAFSSPPARDDGTCVALRDGKDFRSLGSHGRDLRTEASLPQGGPPSQRRPFREALSEENKRNIAERNRLNKQLLERVSGSTARASHIPLRSRRRLSWTDTRPADLDPLSEKAEVRSLMSEYHDLQKLEVVHDILQKAPQYSATVWSDGTDGGPIPSGPPNDLVPFFRKEAKTVKTGKDSGQGKDELREKTNRSRNKDGDEENPSWCKQTSVPPNEDNLVSSSTQPGDSGEGMVNQGAGEAEDDEWSGSGSLHLADLFRSLRMREHQLLPRARPASDTSQASPSTSPLPVRRHSHDLTKYKTELCRSFQYSGFCEYGDSCLYAHGSLDLRCYPKHPMYRTKQCFSFHNKGFCLYGSRCQFLHDLE